MILLTLQEQGDKPTTYQQIADNIQNRTVQQVSISFYCTFSNLPPFGFGSITFKKKIRKKIARFSQI